MKTLYRNGTILTMTENRYAQALLTEGGKIIAVGNEEDLRACAPEAEVIDLDGHCLMPGFIDPHSHFSQVATALLQVSLNGADSSDDIRGRIAAFIDKNKPEKGSWIAARDYDNNLFPGGKNPTLAELDSFAPGYPLVIHHKSGHMGLFNSEGLAKLGISESSVSPEGGKIEKKDGHLTGYLEENAFFLMLQKIPMADADTLLRVFEKAQDKYASYGITTLQDGMVMDQLYPMYHMLLDKKVLKLDLVAYPGQYHYDEGMRQFGDLPKDCHLRIGGMKGFLDGSPQGRTAWMKTPYQGDPTYTGYGTMTDDDLTEMMMEAGRKNCQLICHCNGDGAAEQFIRCLEQAQKAQPNLKNLRPVIIHAQLMDADQMPRAKALGAMASFFVAHVYHWGDVHIQNFGLARASRISSAKTALDCSLPFTFHQDAPVIEPNMPETIWCAACRMTKGGVHLGKEQEISVYEAIKAVTVNAAYQYGEENEKGRLAPGYKADFVILDRDMLSIPKEEIRNVQVLATIKGGQCVYQKA